MHVIGGARDFVRLLEGVTRLKRQEPSDLPEFFGFSNWNQVIAFSEMPEGEHLQTFVRLVERHGEATLIQALERTTSTEADADLVVSTAHKAKGREWDTVRLTDDFVSQRLDNKGRPLSPDPEEIRLFYVATTRAQTAIDIDPALCAQFEIQQSPMPGAKAKVAMPVTPRTPNIPELKPAVTITRSPPKQRKLGWSERVAKAIDILLGN